MHVLLTDVISDLWGLYCISRWLLWFTLIKLHQQVVTVVYADQKLGDYPLRLSHLYCCTSGERKYMHMLSLSLSLSL